MDSVDLNVAVEIYCSDCDSQLTITSNASNTIYVDGCETCKIRAYNEGKETARDITNL